ncbi:MAG TPA: hypothetical protein VIV06_02280, partial [Candidatus Limnocylindrales bacterium]
RLVDRAADPELEAGVEADDAGQRGALGQLGRRVRPALVREGLVVFAIGAALAIAMVRAGILGGTSTPLYLVPWVAVLGGLWRAAAGLLSR